MKLSQAISTKVVSEARQLYTFLKTNFMRPIYFENATINKTKNMIHVYHFCTIPTKLQRQAFPDERKSIQCTIIHPPASHELLLKIYTTLLP